MPEPGRSGFPWQGASHWGTMPLQGHRCRYNRCRWSPLVRTIARVRYPENLGFRQPYQGAAGCRKPCESSQFEKCSAREAALPGGRCGSVLRRKELQFLLLQFPLDHTNHVGPFACIPVNHLPNQYLERFLRVPGPPALAWKSYMQTRAYRLLPCLQLAQDPPQAIDGSARWHGSSRGSRSGV